MSNPKNSPEPRKPLYVHPRPGGRWLPWLLLLLLVGALAALLILPPEGKSPREYLREQLEQRELPAGWLGLTKPLEKEPDAPVAPKSDEAAALPLSRGPVDAAESVLVENGVAKAVVVTADQPSPVTQLAVGELVEHVKKSTGVELEVLTETMPRPAGMLPIYVGPTSALREAGDEVEKMAPDEFVFRVAPDGVFLAGRDNGEAYSHLSGANGTLHGAYEFLDRALGVRWLWPGELGTYVPRRKTVRLAVGEERQSPAQTVRDFRIGHLRDDRSDAAAERQGFTADGLKSYRSAVEELLRRHRLGRSEPKIVVGHYFGDWWTRYGAQHPDWFTMDEKGERVGPTMNVANPELHRFIVDEVWDGQSNISLGDADKRVYCHSPESMAWDEPLPEGWPLTGDQRVISNRYARFAATIRDLARQRNPDGDFMVSMFMYFNYLHAPTIDIDLSGVYGEFVPWHSGFEVYYPMPEEKHEELKKHWDGWRATGMTMGYRPNYLLGGYVMPQFSTWQAADMFRHAANHGMVAFDFDALWGQWAVKGPMLYLHLRQPSDWEKSTEEIRREFFESFGPAASAVEAYFDYWETFGEGLPKDTKGWSHLVRMGQRYTPEAFAQGRALLDRADEAARTSEDPQYAQRVEFLRQGLRHAELAADLTRRFTLKGKLPSDRPEVVSPAREALEKLRSFRREHEQTFLGDFRAAARVELRHLDLAALDETQGTGLRWFRRADGDGQGEAERWYQPDTQRTAKGVRTMDDGSGESFEIDEKIWQAAEFPGAAPVAGAVWYAAVWRPETGSETVFPAPLPAGPAVVYLNGRRVATTDGASAPSTLALPGDAVRPGAENLLLVRLGAPAISDPPPQR